MFAEHGQTLAAQGVWVPGQPIPQRHGVTSAGDVLLSATSVGFRHPTAAVPALVGLDCEVRASQAIAVLGPNGAGKSTLARLLGGLTVPSTGDITASEGLRDSADRHPHKWRAATLARRIGSVFQNPEHQFVTSRVHDELALGPRRTGAPKSIVDELLSRLRLDDLALANPYTLSGGEQRRLSVATALASAPRVLILDEPTFGQDRRTWIELVELLAQLRDEGRAIVAVTHDTDFVAAFADRTLRLTAPTVASKALNEDPR